MAFPILELIMQDLEETLMGIQQVSSFNTDVTVSRFNRKLGNSPRDKLIVLHQGNPRKFTPEGFSAPDPGHVYWEQPISIVCYVQESDSSDVPLDQRTNTIRADVEKSVMLDPHRNELAIDTIVDDPELLNTAEGFIAGVSVNLLIRYRTLLNDPYSL